MTHPLKGEEGRRIPEEVPHHRTMLQRPLHGTRVTYVDGYTGRHTEISSNPTNHDLRNTEAGKT